jgi:S-DNA-T family DNA segregation ATPase FtsK/SpoIIIE
MAAKKSRPEKTVLSRQEIASRKRAIQEKRLSTGSGARRAIAGVFVLAVGLLSTLSLASFDVRDRVGPGFHNAVGPVGHGLAESMFGLLGYCAFVVPLALLWASAVLFIGGAEKRRWPQVVAAVMLVLAGSVLCQLAFASKGAAHPAGGAIGQELARVLCGLFSVAGTVILVSAVCVAALIVGTNRAFLKVCALAGRGVVVLWNQAVAAVLAGIEAQKQAAEARREKRAQEQLEEAAFLAQLEADEDELDEAEKAAREAEAAQAELERNARLAEAAKAKPRPELVEGAPKITIAPAKKAEKPKLIEAAQTKVEAAVVQSNGDPAWVSAFAAEVKAAPAEEKPAPRKKREEKSAPVISLPPGPSQAPVAAAPVEEKPAAPVVAAPAPASEPSPSQALARMPLIVEPKAPPKPTAAPKKEEFQFARGLTRFTTPPLDVLECDKKERSSLDKEAFLTTAEKLRAKLADFGIIGEVVEIRPGPVVTMYEFLPGPGIKVSKIASLADDLAMAMEAMRVRIVAPIPGKGVVGIEVPNKDRETVFLKEIAEQDSFTKSAGKLTMCLGKDIEGMPYLLDLAKAPHLLIAGTTGSGKSVAVNSMIMSLLLKATPEEVRFIMVDPKMLELSVYEGIPHLLLPVVTDPKKAALALRWAVEEMERRYHLLSEAGVRNITGYNKLVESAEGQAKAALKELNKAPEKAAPKKKTLIIDVADGETEDQALERSAADGLGVPVPKHDDEEVRESVHPEPVEGSEGLEADAGAEDLPIDLESKPDGEPEKKELKKLPYIVVIIDELADLMMVASREVETYIARLAQMARAAGIHLMVATQRPSTDVVTGVIKANFPTRISFMLRSKPDSMTILGTIGAEALLGMGDMLIMPPTSAHLQRVHGAYVSEHEIKRAVDHLKAQGKPVYDESILKARDEEGEGGGDEEELNDELWDQALAVVSEMQQISISMLQRKMRIGYNRAARMIERMEREGIVGAADGAKPREVLVRPVGEMPGAGAM